MSFCHLICGNLGNHSSGVTKKVGSMGEVTITTSGFHTVHSRASLVPRFWDPSHGALVGVHGWHPHHWSLLHRHKHPSALEKSICLFRQAHPTLALVGAAGSWLCSKSYCNMSVCLWWHRPPWTLLLCATRPHLFTDYKIKVLVTQSANRRANTTNHELSWCLFGFFFSLKMLGLGKARKGLKQCLN